MRTGGAYLAPGRVKSAVLDLEPLRQIVIGEVAPLELWLGQKVSAWHKLYIGD